ncbi:PREDICTED: uncharacterized protein LOC104610255 [Nelumbo nucifera]|uniref:Uncharacterized protein LOC104610255 n=1 Tax=Nelumbo nucifera TaxID=4432 RepID=A0A1U8BEG6_NELNU|nr:PREDICTED: uncharacterized protein LOC104610255 [Nelumbo nucifera]
MGTLVALVIIQIGIGLCIHRRKSIKNTTTLSHMDPNFKGLIILSYREIKDLTGSFKHCLGPKRFKGVLPSNQAVAIKDLKAAVSEKQFRLSQAYRNGVMQFIDFAFTHSSQADRILCPCIRCNNLFWVTRWDARDHLICEGFSTNYTFWKFHGEESAFVMHESGNTLNGDPCPNDDMRGLQHNAFGFSYSSDEDNDAEQKPKYSNDFEGGKFLKLLEDADKELYPGCKKFTKLSFIVGLYHIKCISNWSNQSFTMLLELLKDALPTGETLPNSFYEVKKIIVDLGLSYNKIDACPNDCMLYWKEAANDQSCSKCGASRWDEAKNSNGVIGTSSLKNKKIVAKILCHFPLKPRLQRLFISSHTTTLMRWHEEGRTKDGVLRHPVDSPTWKTFDNLHPDFNANCRSVRLGLAADGFNPFRTMSITYSTWPVILIPYNLPPWMCMKQSYFIIFLLISGPFLPGNDIDVYLQPLIDDLKELWEVGVITFDASTKKLFPLYAALMWTISDFPAYSMLSGWSTKGRYACLCCNKKTNAQYCYMGHRRFLEHDHKFRTDKRSFNGKNDFRTAPPTLHGSDVLSQLEGFVNTFGKKPSTPTNESKKRKVHNKSKQIEEQDG